METAKLRIVTDTEPPKIVAQTARAADVPSRISDILAGAAPVRRGKHIDVDAVLARSLPKVAEDFDRAA